MWSVNYSLLVTKKKKVKKNRDDKKEQKKTNRHDMYINDDIIILGLSATVPVLATIL